MSRPARIASAGAKPANPVKVPLKTVDDSLLELAYKNAPKGKFDYPTASNFNITLKKIDTGFHYKNYGFKTFKDLLLSLAPRFEMIMNENKTLYIKRTA